jgi:hypothetical protein
VKAKRLQALQLRRLHAAEVRIPARRKQFNNMLFLVMRDFSLQFIQPLFILQFNNRLKACVTSFPEAIS